MTLIVHRSNRTERLADALAEVLRTPLGSPFVPECVVVHSTGLQRWLVLALAERLGVAANFEFPFPKRFLLRAMSSVLKDGVDDDPFRQEALAWAIAAHLTGHQDEPAFLPVRQFVGEGSPAVRAKRTLELSLRVAALFDRYVTHRPELCLRFEQGEDAHWQAELWRAMVARLGPLHFAARLQAWQKIVQGGHGPLPGLPARLSLFGISSLPQAYLAAFAALARRIDVHLFIMSPSREYWAELRSRREQLAARWRAERRALRAGDAGAWGAWQEALDEAEMALAEGHPLLAAQGGMGRDFARLLEGETEYHEDDEDRYVDPAEQQRPTLLARLQSDILHLRGRRGEGEARPVLEADDRSLGIHCCHGPMREVSVLRDQIIDALETLPDLQPHHIVVMCPELPRYAPMFEAVFGSTSEGALPFRLVYEGGAPALSVWQLCDRLWRTATGRLGFTEVFDLLGHALVYPRFGLTLPEVDTLRLWLADAGVRWGADEAHKRAVMQPAVAQNTWRQGLERLLLGYALPSESDATFAGVWPAPGPLGSEAQALGGFIDFWRALLFVRQTLASEQSAAAWCTTFVDLARHVLGAGAEVDDAADAGLFWLAEACGTVAKDASAGGFDARVGWSAVWPEVAARASQRVPVRGFIGSGITVCDMVPMRSVPFRVVCLVGLADGAFPRRDIPYSFDLAKTRRPGDRSRRDDDRYSLLEALLSARDRVIITYPGQSQHGEATAPPSVVVGELCEAVAATFALPRPTPPTAEDWRERLITLHPLFGHSPRYFDGASPKLWSYSHNALAAARALCGAPQPPATLLTKPSAVSQGGPMPVVSLSALAQFLAHPLRFFLAERLGIRLHEFAAGGSDREPTSLAGLPRWRLGDALLRAALGGTVPEVRAALLRQGGAVPYGVIGDLALAEVVEQARALAERTLAARAGRQRVALPVDRVLGGARLVGSVSDVYPGGLVRAGFGRLGGRLELSAWLGHLMLCWLAPPGVPLATRVLGLADNAPAEVVFAPVAKPDERLATLVELFLQGQERLLPLPPKTAQAFVEKRLKSDDLTQALTEAEKTYVSTFGPCERDEAWVRHALRGALPWYDEGLFSAEEFAAVAEAIFLPMLLHENTTAQSLTRQEEP